MLIKYIKYIYGATVIPNCYLYFNFLLLKKAFFVWKNLNIIYSLGENVLYLY